MDVAVVGGGFWGCAVARRLKSAGASVTVYDDGAPSGASRSAAGICKLSWYRQQTVTKMMGGVFTYNEFREGFDWLQDQVPVRHVPEIFDNKTLNRTSIHRDNYLGDPYDLLRSTPVMSGAVERIIPGERCRLIGDDIDRTCDAVVVAAGAQTDDVLARSGMGRATGVKPLQGRALVFSTDEPGDAECVTVMVRPYVHYTFRRLRNGRIRVGDTVERVSGEKRLDELKRVAVARYPDMYDTVVIGGTRPVCDRMHVKPVAKGVIAATGGHRVGYGLSGAVAARVESLL